MSRHVSVLFVLLAAVLAGAVLVAAVTLPSGSPPDDATEDFDRRVHAYLMANPEVIMEAVAVLERRNDARRVADARGAILRNRARLESAAPLPVLGNPDGDVTVVEFFDYRCGFCKRAKPEVAALLRLDGKVRLVPKEFPVLGPESIMASRAAIASVAQGKYEAFHNALMSHPGPFDDESILRVARSVGIDVERLLADMNKPEVAAVIRDNHLLARALGINGTPAFVIGDQLLPGLINTETMKQAVIGVRRGNAAMR